MKRSRISSEYLDPLSGQAKRKRFVVYDLESKDGPSERPGFTRPFLAGFYDGVAYKGFRDEPHLANDPAWQTRHVRPGGCVDHLLREVLTREYAGTHIYAHNGGSFDHLFLLAWLKAHDDEFGFEVVPVQSSIQKIEVWAKAEEVNGPPTKKKKRSLRWIFLDSMKLLNMGLDRAAKAFALAGKSPMDLTASEDDTRWEEYNRNDCLVLYQVVELFHDMVEEKLGGEVGMTAPATAMKLFRRQYLGKSEGSPKRVPRHVHFADCTSKATCPGCCHAFIREAYYGGRTEVFRVHGTGLRYYDLNSSYAAAMLEDMPAGDRLVTNTLDWRYHEQNIGFAEVDVEIPPDCDLPPLPYRDRKTGKLIFPAGRFSGTWDLDELKLLDDVGGRILNVRKVVWYRRKKLFKDMVETLWKMRDKSLASYDQGLDQLAKLMLNSCYGKFGMQEERTQIVFQREVDIGHCFLCAGEIRGLSVGSALCDECEGSKPANGDPESIVWYQRRRVEAPYIIPQIAAHITALARIRLWRWTKNVLDDGGKVFMNDTDSCLTDLKRPSSTKLGEMKEEYPDVDDLEGTFLQPKMYMLRSEKHWKEAKVTAKGFPRSLRTEETFEKIRTGAVVSYERIEKIRSLARNHFKAPPSMVAVKKSIRSSFDKRVLLPDGSTKPLVLDALYQEDDVQEAAE